MGGALIWDTVILGPFVVPGRQFDWFFSRGPYTVTCLIKILILKHPKSTSTSVSLCFDARKSAENPQNPCKCSKQTPKAPVFYMSGLCAAFLGLPALDGPAAAMAMAIPAPLPRRGSLRGIQRAAADSSALLPRLSGAPHPQQGCLYI